MVIVELWCAYAVLLIQVCDSAIFPAFTGIEGAMRQNAVVGDGQPGSEKG
jgi:hypothetical protein